MREIAWQPEKSIPMASRFVIQKNVMSVNPGDGRIDISIFSMELVPKLMCNELRLSTSIINGQRFLPWPFFFECGSV